MDSVDLEIARGELFGLLGPNGAGKTTIIKMLTTMLKPTDGEALSGGLVVLLACCLAMQSLGAYLFETSDVD